LEYDLLRKPASNFSGSCCNAAKIERISPAEAVRIAAPSTLQQLPGDEARKLRALAGVFTALPCFRLHLAREGRKNLLAIARTMDALQRRAVQAS
jgi:hypothetical protein